MMKQIDLNCDLGESFGPYTIGNDQQVMQYITSANIACGYHAGDPLCMEQTVAAAKQAGVKIGAHPGFPDLMGFGRRELRCSSREIKAYIQYQVGALGAFAAAHQMSIQHVKPHGALYNMACRDTDLANAIVDGIQSLSRDLILLCPAGSQMEQAALRAGLPVACEVFADRAYDSTGNLVPRSQKGSVILDPKEVVERAVGMALEGTVQSITGEVISLRADSICIHGDTPGAISLVRELRKALLAAGVTPTPLEQFVRRSGGDQL